MNESTRIKRPSLTIFVVAVSFLACSEGGSEFLEVEGWTLAGAVLTYDADNLWEYINGAAELFVQYDVQTCRTADLASGNLVVTVDLYDTGSPLNALGVFKQENPAGGPPLPGATMAAVSPPYQALLLKGAAYVKVNAIEGELTETSGRELLEALARALPGQATLPPELGLLPEEGKVAGSEGYQREGFLGLTELPGCVFADYSAPGDETWQGFVVVPPAGSSPAAAWDALAGDWTSLKDAGLNVLYRDIPYRGLVGVAMSDGSIIGVAGAADQRQLVSRLESFVQ
ncbi:MAG: hypothetical protein JSW46_13135 [Gemmatimonadota bacterium]|nr:MAG: hypothetical protein JSW46_13135 [Gemmatimonadota bacterium]